MLRVLLAIFLLIPLPVLADHVPTQPAYGQNLTTDNNAGTITIGILGSDGWEDSPPENYTIFFSGSSGITETNSFCVTTSFGHQTNTWQYYTFSNDDLKYYFADLAGKNFYFAIRSNNETDNSVSTLTTESVYNIYAGPPFEFNQTDWSAPTGTDACNPYVVTTTTTTTSSTTSTTTTTTTTTTTLPPKPPEPTQEEKNFAETGIYETDSERYNREIEEAKVKEEEETAIRDEQRKANEEKYGCYMTDAQIERGDCKLPEEEPVEEIKEEDTLFKQEEKDIIVVDDTKEELPDDDVVVLEVESKDEDKEFIEPPKEEVIEFTEEELEEIKFEEVKEEVKEFIEDIVIEEEVFEMPEEIIIVLPEEPIEEIVEDELDQEILRDDIIREEEVQEEDGKELEQVQDILVSVEEEDIEEYVEELEPEEVIEIVESVVEVGVSEITEEEVAVVTEVVEQAIEDVEELTEEQVEVVAEVLSVETEDVEIIAETAKDDEVIAEAVEVFVQKAVENKDVEDYTFADVVTEIQFDNFIENPIEVLVDFEDIDLSTIGQDMTQDQKEKAQEVVVPVILTRIASMAAFVFRRTL
jgi:hypothetical protein